MTPTSEILTLRFLGTDDVFAPLASLGIDTFTLNYSNFGPFVAYSEINESVTFVPITSWFF